MVNMYSMGMMGSGMYGMYGGGGMNSVYGGNAHAQLKQRYGVGYEDFGTSPYAQPYPMAVIPRTPDVCYENPICRFFRKFFG